MADDPIVAAVIADLERRSAAGIEKYGTTLAGNPLTLERWLQHAYEEALDLALYLRRAMTSIVASDRIRELLLANNREVERRRQAERDVRTLLANYDFLAECTGEAVEGEDAAMIEDIRQRTGD
ncbi:hypothetical protein [Oceanibaculum nanhaiense]|uniref:hypothetical protein n=1 Tax=Oceanibaculum nanhaiense TaxID=1909734 RepID=UPI003D2B51DA